ncbi:MAG: hypothetical protein MJ033_01905 [Victivallaceae bacterium]|nr:hypothetical protein [Victivallaceae bacterium]
MKKRGFLLLFCSACLLFAAEVPQLQVHFDQSAGEIRKQLHGSGYMPNISEMGNYHKGNDFFRKLHFSMSRTHDQVLFNPGERVVDTVCVFPLEKLDPEDASNYCFKPTDFLLSNLVSCGTLPYYRLGVSTENTPDDHHFNSEMPKDAVHYAKILAGIIRHYNYGWADGFKMNIPYWEIWNEPDIGCKMWKGDMAQFNRFFVTVLKHLKQEFPDEKIGGPGYQKLCGVPLGEKNLRDLLALCKEENVKPDFISFHFYGYDVYGYLAYLDRIRAILDECGFKDTEMHLNEWHYNFDWAWRTWDEVRGGGGIDSAAFNVAMFAGFHDKPLDVACYYGAGQCNIWNYWGLFDRFHNVNRNYRSMEMIGKLVAEYPRRIKTCVIGMPVPAAPEFKSVSMIAGLNDAGNGGCLLVSDFRGDAMQREVELKHFPANARTTVVRFDHHTREPVPVTPEIVDGKLVLRKEIPGSCIWMATFDWK